MWIRKKAYDKVPRKLVWEALRRRGVDEGYVKVVKDMYKGARTSVKTERRVLDSFEVNIGYTRGQL